MHATKAHVAHLLTIRLLKIHFPNSLIESHFFVRRVVEGLMEPHRPKTSFKYHPPAS